MKDQLFESVMKILYEPVDGLMARFRDEEERVNSRLRKSSSGLRIFCQQGIA